MTDDLSETERRALDAWPPSAPPAGFADRVLAARAPVAPRRRLRRAAIGGALAAALAAATILVVVRGDHAAHGALSPRARETAAIGDRAVVVAEPAARLAWDVAPDGAAEITQPAGDVFYRVERGGPFVVHTPAGDIHVTGTCFRIEVEMNKSAQLVLSGIAGAAVATAVIVTVYEGRVIADAHGARDELAPGTRTVFEPPASAHVPIATPPPVATAIAAATSPSLDVAHASRDQLVARIAAQDTELAQLRAKPGGGGAPYPLAGLDGPFPDGRPWYDPSPETLKEWAADCRVRYDLPAFDHVVAAGDHDLTADEAAKYNAIVSDLQKTYTALVRALYVATTGDPATADSLSLDGMITEIMAKAPAGEHAADGQLLAQERAGLAPVPADTTHEPPLEQLLRAQAALGGQLQDALADRVGAARAVAIRGDGFDMRREMAGCPEK